MRSLPSGRLVERKKSRLKCGCSQNWPPYKAVRTLTVSLILATLQ
jgi:hypothetical protein